MTKSKVEDQLKRYQRYLERYRNYPGSSKDDAILGIYGYTVGDERAYIRHKIKYFKDVLKYMKEHNVEEVTSDVVPEYIF